MKTINLIALLALFAALGLRAQVVNPSGAPQAAAGWTVIGGTTSTPGNAAVGGGLTAYSVGGPATSMLAQRHWEAQATVSTTISAALASITDASSIKHYRLNVGTSLSDNVVPIPYVDIICAPGVTISPANAALDTIADGGIQYMLAGCNVVAPASHYAIHHDNNNGIAPEPGMPTQSVTTIYENVTATSSGDHAPLGIGVDQYQSLYVLDSTFTSTGTNALACWAHNAAIGQSAPMRLYFVNDTCISTVAGALSYGFAFGASGSAQPDTVVVQGGVYRGLQGGLLFENSGAGAGEEYFYANPASGTITVTSGHQLLSAPSIANPELADNYLPEWRVIFVQPGTGNIAAWSKFIITKIANGTSGCATTAGCWQVNSGTPIAATATSSQILPVFLLPVNAQVERVVQKTTTVFSGTTTETAQVGNNYSGNGAYVPATYNLMAAVGATNFANTQVVAAQDLMGNGAETLTYTIYATGTTVDQTATGSSVTAWVKYSVLP